MPIHPSDQSFQQDEEARQQAYNIEYLSLRNSNVRSARKLIAPSRSEHDSHDVLDKSIPRPSNLMAGLDGTHFVFDLKHESSASSNEVDTRSDTISDAPAARSGNKNALSHDHSSSSTLSGLVTRSQSTEVMLQHRPRAIDTSRVTQVQMLSDFLEMHFPTPEAKANLAYRGSYLSGLPDIDLSSTPMLRNAVEAICLAHAGSNYQDVRLVRQSQVSYGKVLNALPGRCRNQASRTIRVSLYLVSCCFAFTMTLYHCKAKVPAAGEPIIGAYTTT